MTAPLPDQTKPKGRPPPSGFRTEAEAAGLRRFAYLASRIPPQRPLDVLDVGCSECLEGEALLAAGVGLTGIDQDEASIRVAGRRLPKGTFVCADADDLPQAWRGRFHVILIRRPDLLAQPGHWIRVFCRLHEWLAWRGGIIVTTVTADEAILVVNWLGHCGFMNIDQEEIYMTDEARIVVASKQEKLPVQDGKAPPKRVVKWDEGEAGPVYDLETGECLD